MSRARLRDESTQSCANLPPHGGGSNARSLEMAEPPIRIAFSDAHHRFSIAARPQVGDVIRMLVAARRIAISRVRPAASAPPNSCMPARIARMPAVLAPENRAGVRALPGRHPLGLPQWPQRERHAHRNRQVAHGTSLRSTRSRSLLLRFDSDRDCTLPQSESRANGSSAGNHSGRGAGS